MKRRSLLNLLGAIALAALIAIPFAAGCAPEEAPAPAPAPATYSWRIAQAAPEATALGYQAVELFCKRANELSGGRMNIKHYPGDLLGDYTFCTEAVARGTLDFNLSVAPTKLDPRLNVAGLAYVVFDVDSAREAYAPGGWALTACSGIAGDIGWKLLGIGPEGWNGIISKVEFTPHPDEVKARALKIRVMPKESERVIAEAFGFSPTVIPYSDLYMSLQTGLVDVSQGQPPLPHIAEKFNDALQPQPYYYDYKYVFATYWIIANLEMFNSLPTEDQQILLAVTGEVIDWLWSAMEEKNEAFLETLDRLGWILVELTPEQKAANVRAARDAQWPFMESNIGSLLMDDIKENASVPPGG